MSTRVIILAAGKGRRMGSETMPKVLQPLKGRPLVSYVIDAVKTSGVDDRPVLIVGHMADEVKRVCGGACDYALQKELRGTGDAVRSARSLIEGSADHVLVLNGDHPLVTSRLIRRMNDDHLASGATLTMGTVTVRDFEDWRKPFADFGRVERGPDGGVRAIVEVKDASPDQLGIRELNLNLLCFKASWLWPNLETLTTENAQGEYYLTALIAQAIAGGERVETVPVPLVEAVGVNTPEQLAVAERMLGDGI